MTLTCEKCDYSTELTANYNRHNNSVKHKKAVGEIDKFHHCDQCDYKSNRKYNLQLHISRMHDENSEVHHKFECVLCQKTFRDMFNLKVHTKSALHLRARIRAFNAEKKQLDPVRDPEYESKHAALLKKYSLNIKMIDKRMKTKAGDDQTTKTTKPKQKKQITIPTYTLNSIKQFLTPADETPKQTKHNIMQGLLYLASMGEKDSVDWEYYKEHHEEMTHLALMDFQFEVFREIEQLVE